MPVNFRLRILLSPKLARLRTSYIVYNIMYTQQVPNLRFAYLSLSQEAPVKSSRRGPRTTIELSRQIQSCVCSQTKLAINDALCVRVHQITSKSDVRTTNVAEN